MTRPIFYGQIPFGLADVPSDAVQVSPLVPGSTSLESLSTQSATGLTMRAPPNTLERHHDMAMALRALAIGSPFTILAAKDKGGSRLLKELASFGVMAADNPKRHHRICTGIRPATLTRIDAALAKGGMSRVEATDLFAQPGIFSWDRIDTGTALLLANLPHLWGHVADFGCGNGVLSLAALKSAKVKSLIGIDSDRRALAACALNIIDARFKGVWADVRATQDIPANLDFILTNPPFHDAGEEDQALGLAFIKVAAQALRTGGTLWLTANRHLPYEAVLTALFKSVSVKAESQGYKVFEAIK
jgi:16S rRNA (guanine1207-N2)-methyltransferase